MTVPATRHLLKPSLPFFTLDLVDNIGLKYYLKVPGSPLDKRATFCYHIPDNDNYYQNEEMLKKTKQKEVILRVLRSTTSHPTATWIYDEVRKEIPNISLGTVYRNLRLLKERGEILELELNGTASRFDARTDNHDHFTCEKCGHVFDIDEPVGQKFNGRVARKTGFKISYYRLEFHGLCRECQES